MTRSMPPFIIWRTYPKLPGLRVFLARSSLKKAPRLCPGILAAWSIWWKNYLTQTSPSCLNPPPNTPASIAPLFSPVKNKDTSAVFAWDYNYISYNLIVVIICVQITRALIISFSPKLISGDLAPDPLHISSGFVTQPNTEVDNDEKRKS